jgi:hypothetical protein
MQPHLFHHASNEFGNHAANCVIQPSTQDSRHSERLTPLAVHCACPRPQRTKMHAFHAFINSSDKTIRVTCSSFRIVLWFVAAHAPPARPQQRTVPCVLLKRRTITRRLHPLAWTWIRQLEQRWMEDIRKMLHHRARSQTPCGCCQSLDCVKTRQQDAASRW